MIRRWEMAFWAMLAGTSLQVSCFSAGLYGMPIDDTGLDHSPYDYGSPDSVVPDLPGDPIEEDVEDVEADEVEDARDVEDEDMEDEG